MLALAAQPEAINPKPKPENEISQGKGSSFGSGGIEVSWVRGMAFRVQGLACLPTLTQKIYESRRVCGRP